MAEMSSRQEQDLTPAADSVSKSKISDDKFGIFALILLVAGIAVGFVPVIGSPLRLVAACIALGLGGGGVIEGRKNNLNHRLSKLSIIGGVIVFVWSVASLAAIGGIIAGLFSNI